MFKNNHGVTLTILVITIIIMLILAAVTMSININTSKTIDLKELVVNMELIRTSAQGYADRYVGTEGDIENLPGINSSYVNGIMGTLIGSTHEDDDAIELSTYWFLLDQEALDTMGLDIKLQEHEAYFVDYKTMEVAYVKSTTPVNGTYPGITTKDEKVLYFYDQIKNLKADDIGN